MACCKGWWGVGTGGTDGTGWCGLATGGTDCTYLLPVLPLQQFTSVWCFRSFLFRLACLSVPFFPMCCSSHILSCTFWSEFWNYSRILEKSGSRGPITVSDSGCRHPEGIFLFWILAPNYCYAQPRTTLHAPQPPRYNAYAPTNLPDPQHPDHPK